MIQWQTNVEHLAMHLRHTEARKRRMGLEGVSFCSTTQQRSATNCGETTRNRTGDPRLKRPVLLPTELSSLNGGTARTRTENLYNQIVSLYLSPLLLWGLPKFSAPLQPPPRYMWFGCGFGHDLPHGQRVTYSLVAVEDCD